MQQDDIAAIIAAGSIAPWAGSAWRYHRRRYDPTDTSGALRVSGRYHRGLDRHPVADCFPALYLALDPLVCACELVRTIVDRIASSEPSSLQAQIGRLNVDTFRFTRFELSLARVLDCRPRTGASAALQSALTGPEIELTRNLASVDRQAGIEALIVPSATLVGDNLILFPDIVADESRFAPVEHFDPVLTRNWS